MTTIDSFASLVVGNDYPLVRDFLAYGLGMVSRVEARERLGPTTVPTCIDGISQDDVEILVRFVCETFGFRPGELGLFNGHPLSHYILVLVRVLKDHGVAPREACVTMRGSLPEDWFQDAAS
jgi:hypothetical protein